MLIYTENLDGAQVDFLIYRADQSINLVECKYHKNEFYLTKTEAEKIRSIKAIFAFCSGTKKQVNITLKGFAKLHDNKKSIVPFDKNIDGDIFFKVNEHILNVQLNLSAIPCI